MADFVQGVIYDRRMKPKMRRATANLGGTNLLINQIAGVRVRARCQVAATVLTVLSQKNVLAVVRNSQGNYTVISAFTFPAPWTFQFFSSATKDYIQEIYRSVNSVTFTTASGQDAIDFDVSMEAIDVQSVGQGFFPMAGPYNYTVPTSGNYLFEAVGGGQSGATLISSGAGGDYSSQTAALVAGDLLTFNVGAGGIGSLSQAYPPSGNGILANGGDTTIFVNGILTVVAAGGGTGTSDMGGTFYAGGGATSGGGILGGGGSAAGGGTGNPGSLTIGGTGGTPGGTGFSLPGGNGGNGSSVGNGGNGTWPGGGGGTTNVATAYDGNGADGYALITPQ